MNRSVLKKVIIWRSWIGRWRKEETMGQGIGKNRRSVNWLSRALRHVHFKTINIKMLN